MQICSIVLWRNNIVTIKSKGSLMIIHLLLLLSFLIFNVQTTEQQQSNSDSSSKQTHPRVDHNEVQLFQQNKTIGSRSRNQFLITTKRIVQRKKQKHNYNRVQQTSEKKANEFNVIPEGINYPNDTSLHASRNQLESFINVLFRLLRMEKPSNISAFSVDSIFKAKIMKLSYQHRFSQQNETETNQYRSHHVLSRNKCLPSSPCCRRPLTLHFNDSHLLNFILYPRVLDIGECVGLCGFSSVNQLKITNSSQHNLSSIKEQHSGVNDRCCSFSRTGGLELFFATEKKSVVQLFLPHMIIEACRCSSALIV
ncbi:unnamed protein product [Didymodactylos carnosus]|uniref:TGF-beta family profile domain-containing protein n=1 Tax=Didymodactylos carnosus TaxID=1234261 RepID=A0A815JY46_9BILA|nr:unnamed protein product [Didymodactylos carnosus]CAF1386062.1 unnamed protein product [Didymodactylos carnosus]CAF3742579.1 unnamed protein product [Didymodactylos carnosus]CAF4281073.1 unnamed protein product [Didymodactylos carnosus]